MSRSLRRAPAPRASASRLLLPVVSAILAIAFAAVVTLAGTSILATARRPMAGAPRQPATTPAAEPSATASPAGLTPSPSPLGVTPGHSGGRAAAADAVLVALDLPGDAPAGRSPLDEVARVLAVSREGDLVASVARFGAPGALHVTRPNGADRQFRFGPPALPAPVVAAFSPDAAWLAVVSGNGQLFRLELGSGRSSLISPGTEGLVFGLSLAFAPDGRLLTTQVASLDVPLPSRIVAVDPVSGEVEVLSGQTSAYHPIGASDGSVVFFVTRNDGTTEVRRLNDGIETIAAALGETAWVDASRDGRHAAAQRPDGNVVVVELASGTSRVIGHGSRPEFSPMGDRVSVLDLELGRARVLDLAGRELARIQSLPVAWAVCPEGCES